MKTFRQPHRLLRAVIVGAAVCTASNPVWAQTTELDLDMFVVDENASAAEVINQIPLPPPTVTSINLPDTQAPDAAANRLSPEVLESLDQLQTTTDGTLDAATQNVTEAINDAISSGDLTNLPPEVNELLPDEVVDQIIDGADLDVVDDLTGETDDLLDNADALLDGAPELNNIDAALDELETIDEAVNAEVPDINSVLDELPPPDQIVEMEEIDVDAAVEEAVQELEQTTEDAAPANDLLPDLLNR